MIGSAIRHACLCILLLLCKPAAAVLYVGGTCQFATIQAAINAAGADEAILISSGTYPEFLEIKDKNIVLQGGYTGCGTAPGNTIVDARSHAGHSVLNIQGSSSDLLYQIELTGGSAPGQGGGIASKTPQRLGMVACVVARMWCAVEDGLRQPLRGLAASW